MKKKQQRLVWCLREQWLSALRCNVELRGDALVLDTERCGAGLVCLPAADSGETGYAWGRVTLDCALPRGSSLRVYALALDEREGFWQSLSASMREAGQEYGRAQHQAAQRFGAPAGTGPELLVEQRGRYLWLAVEFLSGSAEDVVLRKVTFWMGGDRMSDHLPAIYRGDPTTERFLEIFHSMLQDMEERINGIPALLDYENDSEAMLRYLSGWLYLDGRHADLRALRRWVASAAEDVRTMYTPAGIRRTVRRLTGQEPILIEYAQVDPNAPDCVDQETCRRLFGEDPCRFFVLLKEDAFQTREEAQSFMDQMRKYIPAQMEMQLVLLRSKIHLGGHTYLGINSTVSGFVPAAVDESTAIHFDTVIGEEAK